MECRPTCEDPEIGRAIRELGSEAGFRLETVERESVEYVISSGRLTSRF
jgi:hypothetical protein